MSSDLVLRDADQCFDLAARIVKSNLIPSHYRGKEADVAIAMLYGAEMGLPPMTSLQRVVVISGKPTLDAQGMVSLIRSAGHSISGQVSAQGAKITGTRRDNGDTMTVEWGPEEAKQAGLRSDTYSKFPSDMYWARAVSQLGRRLFADVLLGVSYTPEEMQAVVEANGNGTSTAPVEPEPVPTTRRPPPRTDDDPVADEETGEIIDAEVVTDDDEPAPTKRINELRKVFAQQHQVTDEAEMCLISANHLDGKNVAHLKDLTDAEVTKVLAGLADLPAPVAAGVGYDEARTRLLPGEEPS